MSASSPDRCFPCSSSHLSLLRSTSSSSFFCSSLTETGRDRPESWLVAVAGTGLVPKQMVPVPEWRTNPAWLFFLSSVPLLQPADIYFFMRVFGHLFSAHLRSEHMPLSDPRLRQGGTSPGRGALGASSGPLGRNLASLEWSKVALSRHSGERPPSRENTSGRHCKWQALQCFIT